MSLEVSASLVVVMRIAAILKLSFSVVAHAAVIQVTEGGAMHDATYMFSDLSGTKLATLVGNSTALTASTDLVSGHGNSLDDMAARLAALEAFIGIAAPVDRGPVPRRLFGGDHHLCALVTTTLGTVTKCWGKNNLGQLGVGDTNNRFLPTEVLALPPGSGVVAMSLGGSHSCALMRTGVSYCWGWNGVEGVLGIGSTATLFNTPQLLTSIGTNAVAISAARQNTCILMKDQSVRCAGNNNYAQIGVGTIDDGSRTTPVEPTGLGTSVQALPPKMGSDIFCVLMDDSSIKCWSGGPYPPVACGSNVQFNLGTCSTLTPTSMPDLGTDVAAVVMGGHSVCALMVDNVTKCFGDNTYGQLGLGDTSSRTTFITVTALGANVTTLVMGLHHACAIMNDGTTTCWGKNEQGQLGLGDTSNRLVPTTVQALGTDAVELALGVDFTCAARRSGIVHCFGSNALGQVHDHPALACSVLHPLHPSAWSVCAHPLLRPAQTLIVNLLTFPRLLFAARWQHDAAD